MRSPFVCVGNFKLIKTIPAKRFCENMKIFDFRYLWTKKKMFKFQREISLSTINSGYLIVCASTV